jgi:hypothetical protein
VLATYFKLHLLVIFLTYLSNCLFYLHFHSMNHHIKISDLLSVMGLSEYEIFALDVLRQNFEPCLK